MNLELIKALIEGQASRKAEIVGEDLNQYLMRIDTGKAEHPSIYLNTLCADIGISSTPAQWRTVCDTMQEYVGSGTAATSWPQKSTNSSILARIGQYSWHTGAAKVYRVEVVEVVARRRRQIPM